MRLCCLLLVLLLAQSFAAWKRPNAKRQKKPFGGGIGNLRAAANFDSVFTGYSAFDDFATLPYTAVFYSPNPFNKIYGYGVIVNQSLVLLPASTAKVIEPDRMNILVYQNIKDVNEITDATRSFKIKEIKIHSNYTIDNVGKNVALIRVCADFEVTAYADIPPSTQLYPVDSNVNPFVYRGATGPLTYFCNTIVSDSQCTNAGLNGFDVSNQYCIKNNEAGIIATKGEIALTSFVLLNGKFSGFVLKSDGVNYCSISKVETYADWIIQNS